MIFADYRRLLAPPLARAKHKAIPMKPIQLNAETETVARQVVRVEETPKRSTTNTLHGLCDEARQA